MGILMNHLSLTPLKATTEHPEDEPTFEHLLGGTSDELRARRPAAFQDFPAHQFFARLWRPLAVSLFRPLAHTTLYHLCQLVSPHFCALSPHHDSTESTNTASLDHSLSPPAT